MSIQLTQILPDFAGKAIADPNGVGHVLTLWQSQRASTLVFPLGRAPSVVRLLALYRYDPFWMSPRIGDSVAGVPTQTEFLFAQAADGSYIVFAPLISGDFRCWLRGTPEGVLELVAESGSAETIGNSVQGLFIASGDQPYQLLERAAQAVCRIINVGRLRKDKALPAFVDQFGWCTWDAFYQEVSHAKVIEGLKDFAAGGVRPRLLILDDGWLSTKAGAAGEVRLASFAPNERFPEGLSPLIRACREDWHVSTVLVWHAVGGYWGGADEESFPGYEIKTMPRRYPPAILEQTAGMNDTWGGRAGVIPPGRVREFYNEFYAYLSQQSVDGVKVDNQGSLLGLGGEVGGALALTRNYRTAMEDAATEFLGGNVINCMSSFNEVYYLQNKSNVTRTFTDFWPTVPSSHGLHVFSNAHVTLWYGHFSHPDWDMFQSGHPMGSYHAAARAVGGCPVYVSDKIDGHDFPLLRKLVLPDGSILRASDVGRPTRDCLFVDPTKQSVLYKVFNTNPAGGVIGVFHCRYGSDTEPAANASGQIRPSDIEGLEGELFAVYAHNLRELRILRRDESWPVELAQLSWEIFTIAPLVDGMAAVGAVGMLNSGAAIKSRRSMPGGGQELAIRAIGEFLLVCREKPRKITRDGEEIPWSYSQSTGELRIMFESMVQGKLLVQ